MDAVEFMSVLRSSHGLKRKEHYVTHLAGTSKQQTCNSLLDIVMAIDVGSYKLKELFMHIWLSSESFEAGLLLRPACKAYIMHNIP